MWEITLYRVPDVDEQGLMAAELVAVLDRRLGRKGHGVVVYVLVQWSNTPQEEATCKPY